MLPSGEVFLCQQKILITTHNMYKNYLSSISYYAQECVFQYIRKYDERTNKKILVSKLV